MDFIDVDADQLELNNNVPLINNAPIDNLVFFIT
jgi:hypothetical protein